MQWLTWGDLRQLVASNTDKPDNRVVTVQTTYNDVHVEQAFIRLDSIALAAEPGCDLQLLLSIVDEDDIEEEQNNSPCKIVDWAGNEAYPGRVFKDTDDAWGFLTEDQRQRHPNATEKEFDDIMGEFVTDEVDDDHDHVESGCKYLGLGLWDCGQTDQH